MHCDAGTSAQWGGAQWGGAQETERVLQGFINSAADSGIISGVQVKLLNELASTWCPGNLAAKNAAPAVASERKAASGSPAAAVPGSTLPRHSDLLLPTAKAPESHDVHQLPSCIAVPTSLPEAPQLHIQPLNLSAGLHTLQHSTPAPQHDPGCFNAALAASSALSGVLPVSDPTKEGLLSHAAALMALTSGISGSFDPAGAAAALLQSQTYNVAAAAAGAPHQQQQVTDEAGPCGASLELLQALGYAPEAATPPAATAAAATAGKTPCSRKQRFTREQHAAILESVERNYAQYPSRYTELVIKEMQARFPGIELNNACVRKIKFRANEANKLQQIPLPQHELAAAYEHQEASDAAHGLVGLACAAAAAAAAEAAPEATASEAAERRALAAAVHDAVVQVPIKADVDQQELLAAEASPRAAHAAAAAAKLRQQHSSSPETVSISGEPVAAVLLNQAKQQQQQQQQGPQSLQLCSTAAAGDDAAMHSKQAALALRLPPTAATTTGSSQAGAEDGIDSATAAAAEAMHLLAGISSSTQQQPAAAGGTEQHTGGAAEPTAAAVSAERALLPAIVTTAGGAAVSAKRKRKALAGGVECEVSTSGTGTSSPLSHQVAEALSAAAELTSRGVSAPAQLGALQAPGAAAASASAPDSQQQQQLMQQLQPHVQGHWGGGFAGPVSLLDLQLQHQQQALQLQLGGGLGGSLAPLQQQQHRALQAPASASGTAAAAAAGHPPAAKRQRLSGTQMAELIASVKHHVQVNPERYTHCVIRDMKEKYPDLELNMGQIRKIKFRTLGNANTKQAGKAAPETSSAAASAGGPPGYGMADGACAESAAAAVMGGAAGH